MLLSEEEVKIKTHLWFAENGDFLKERECKSCHLPLLFPNSKWERVAEENDFFFASFPFDSAKREAGIGESGKGKTEKSENCYKMSSIHLS